jgi:hypothetical protein
MLWSCEQKGLDAFYVLEGRIVELLNQGSCDEALALLDANPDLKRDPRWYFLRADAAAECFSRTRDDKYRLVVSQTLSEGSATFPKSARMMEWCGHFNERIGDRAAADQAYKSAFAIAAQNVNRCPSCPETADDRDVLRELRQNKRPSP